MSTKEKEEKDATEIKNTRVTELGSETGMDRLSSLFTIR